MAARPSFRLTDERGRRSPGSAPGSTACRWRSSSPRPGSGSSRRTRSWPASSASSSCSPRRRARPARATADAARGDRLELRPARRAAPPPARAAGLLRRRLRPRDGRAGLRPGRRARASTSSTGSPSSPTRAWSAGRRSAARSGFPMLETIRAFAVERLEARGRGRRDPAAPRRGVPRPRPDGGAGAVRRRPAALARAPRARARQPAGGARVGGRRARPGDRASSCRSRSGASGRSGATSSRPAGASTRSRPSPGSTTIRSRTPDFSRRSAGSPTGRATSPAPIPALHEARSTRWREIGDRPRSPTRSTTCAFTYNIDANAEGGGADLRPERSAGRSSTRAWRSTARSATSTGSATSCGRSAARTLFAGSTTTAQPDLRRRRATAFTASGDGRWRPGRSTWSASSSVQLEDFAGGRGRLRSACSATSRDAGDITGQALAVEDFSTLALASRATRSAASASWAAARRIQETLGTGLVQTQIDAAGQQAWLDPQPADATPERRARARGRGSLVDPGRGARATPWTTSLPAPG